MASIEARISALAAEVRRRQFASEGPVDPLSQSLFDFETELLNLGKLSKTVFLAELNREDEGGEGLDLEPSDLEAWISAVCEGKKVLW
nr:hypothetical protein [uncultured Oscillibacter sp.]